MNAMDAVILLKKPEGMTSFAAVRQCRNIFHEKKIGHTGTLDPNATGLMIVLLGKYTKYVPFCVSDHKHYIAQFRLGVATDTEDIWGTVVDQQEYRSHSQEELDQVSFEFIGDSKQIPPMYSAIKVNGQKLYDLARKGKVVERQERDIHVSRLIVKKIDSNLYEMDAIVSSGTYIRTLISDYAKKLGELGTMTKLERIGIENISIDEAATFDELEHGFGVIEPDKVIDPEWIRVDVPKYEKQIRDGKALSLDVDCNKVLLMANGSILAAYEKREDGLFHSKRGLF